MALSDLIDIAKYSSGYHPNGPAAPANNLGFMFNSADDQNNKKQQTALKLLQLQAVVKKAQADAATAQRKQALWSSVGPQALTDKSTAGDVTSIVDNETVGGRDAGVVNDGEVAGDAGTVSTPKIPNDTQSNSSLVNMMKGLQPTISPAGDMILSRPKTYAGVAKKYDPARTFDYAKRLTDQSIIQKGQKKKDISPEDYKTLVNENIPQAEKYLYGKALTQPDAAPVDPNADPNADPTGIKKALATAVDAGKTDTPAPGQQGSAPQVQAYNEGQTAINPKTGKRLKFKGGQWQPLN